MSPRQTKTAIPVREDGIEFFIVVTSSPEDAARVVYFVASLPEYVIQGAKAKYGSFGESVIILEWLAENGLKSKIKTSVTTFNFGAFEHLSAKEYLHHKWWVLCNIVSIAYGNRKRFRDLIRVKISIICTKLAQALGI